MNGFETRDFEPKRIFQVMAAWFCFLALVAVGLFLLDRRLTKKEVGLRKFDVKLEGAEVKPQVFDSFENGALARALDHEQRQFLESYGWVSPQKGGAVKTVHVPIEKAIEILGGASHE